QGDPGAQPYEDAAATFPLVCLHRRPSVAWCGRPVTAYRPNATTTQLSDGRDATSHRTLEDHASAGDGMPATSRGFYIADPPRPTSGLAIHEARHHDDQHALPELPRRHRPPADRARVRLLHQDRVPAAPPEAARARADHREQGVGPVHRARGAAAP